MSKTLLDITADRPEKIKTRPNLPGKVKNQWKTEKTLCRWEYYVSGKKKTPMIFLYEHGTKSDLISAASLFNPKRSMVCISVPEWLLYPEKVKKELSGFGKIWKQPYQKSQIFIRQVITGLEEGKNILMAASEECMEPGQAMKQKKSMVKLFQLLQVPVCSITFEENYRRKPLWGTESVEGSILGCVKPMLSENELNSLSTDQLEHILEKAFEKEKEEIYSARKRCEGLESFLFQCPACKNKGGIGTAADGIFCGNCGKIFKMNTAGTILSFRGEAVMESISDWMMWQRQQTLRRALKSELDCRAPGTVYEYDREKQVLLKKGEGIVRVNLSGLTLETDEGTFKHNCGALPSAAVYPFFRDGKTCVVLPFGKRVFYVMTDNSGDAGEVKTSLEILYDMAQAWR